MLNNDRPVVHRYTLPRLTEAWLSLYVGVLAIVAFLPSLWAGFVYDDLQLIADNRYVHELSYLPRAFTTHFWDTFQSEAGKSSLHYYRPVVTVSYLLDWVISGGQAAYFHAVNILLHGACAALITRALARWLPQLWMAGGVGLLFALHPTRAESVIWVSGRTDLMMVFFLLLALHFAQRGYLRRQYATSSLLSAGFFVLALLSKEPAVLFPLLLAIDWAAANTKGLSNSYYRRALIATSTASAAYLAMRLLAYPVHESIATSLSFERGFFTVASYVERIALPWPQTFFHRLTEGELGHFQYAVPWVVLGVTAATAYLAAIVWLAYKDRVSALLLLTAIAFLAPLLNFVDSGLPFTSNDRFLYLPLALVAAGAMRAVSASLIVVARSKPVRRMTRVLTTFLSLGAMALLVLRASDFRSESTHWAHEYATNSLNPLASRQLSLFAANRRNNRRAYELALECEKGFRKYPILDKQRARVERQVRRLQLQATLTADGDIGSLRNIAGALSELEVPDRFKTGEGAEIVDALRAAGASVAARLGDPKRANYLLDTISDERLTQIPNPTEVIVTHARLGNYKKAHALLHTIATNQKVNSRDQPRFDALQQRITLAERMVAADNGPQGQAQAMAHLGAYGLALQALAPLKNAPNSPLVVSQQFAQLLVAARLENAAIELISRHLEGTRAEQIVAGLRTQLPPELAQIRAVPGGYRLLIQ